MDPLRYFSRAERRAVRVIKVVLQVLGVFAPETVAKAAERLFTTTRRHPVPRHEAEIAARAKPFQVPFEGGYLHVYSWGEGPATILLVHGWDGRGTQLGRFVPEALAAGYRVLALDGPGHGKSSGNRCDLFAMVRALHAVDAAAGPFAGVIAHSFGGAASLRAIQRGLLRTPRLVLVGVPDALEHVLDRFNEVFEFSPEVFGRFKRRLERRFGIPIAAARIAGNRPPDGVDALIIHDRHDHEVPFREGEAVHRAWPRARFIATEGLGHRRILKAPEVIAEAIAFVRCEVPAGTLH